MHAAINLALDFYVTTADLEGIRSGDKQLRQETEARRLFGLAHGFWLQVSALREEA
jgi:predicted DNA-binding protein